MKIRRIHKAERIMNHCLYTHHEVISSEDRGTFFEMLLREKEDTYLSKVRILKNDINTTTQDLKGKIISVSKIIHDLPGYNTIIHDAKKEICGSARLDVHANILGMFYQAKEKRLNLMI